MAWPLISVVIPAFNAGRTIDRALASVFAQNYQPLEIIVIDDGSTDDTRASRSIPRQTVRLLRQSKPRSSGRDECRLGVAKGEFIAFLDADDEWLPGKLLIQVPLLVANPSMPFICSRWQETDQSGSVTGSLIQICIADQPVRTCGVISWQGVLSSNQRSWRAVPISMRPAASTHAYPPRTTRTCGSGSPSRCRRLSHGGVNSLSSHAGQSSRSVITCEREGFCPAHGYKAHTRATAQAHTQGNPRHLGHTVCPDWPLSLPGGALFQRALLSGPRHPAGDSTRGESSIHFGRIPSGAATQAPHAIGLSGGATPK